MPWKVSQTLWGLANLYLASPQPGAGFVVVCLTTNLRLNGETRQNPVVQSTTRGTIASALWLKPGKKNPNQRLEPKMAIEV